MEERAASVGDFRIFFQQTRNSLGKAVADAMLVAGTRAAAEACRGRAVEEQILRTNSQHETSRPGGYLPFLPQ